ncbi:MAG TPA: CRISPR-associated endonuclease Cas2 [Candidatus Paceibacterota bacterium]
MGKLEIQSAKRTRKGDMQRAVLMTVAAAGFLSMALLAPNALQALAKLGILDIRGKRRKELINRSRDRLLDAGLLMRDERGYLRLLPKGEAKLRQLELHDYRLKKPKRWDEKWRLLIFDIPERRRYTREKVRNTLQMIGFERLQDSAWVYPYDCEDLVTLLKVDFKIGKDLLYIITDGIENDLMLRKRFGLE